MGDEGDDRAMIAMVNPKRIFGFWADRGKEIAHQVADRERTEGDDAGLGLPSPLVGVHAVAGGTGLRGAEIPLAPASAAAVCLLTGAVAGLRPPVCLLTAVAG